MIRITTVTGQPSDSLSPLERLCKYQNWRSGVQSEQIRNKAVLKTSHSKTCSAQAVVKLLCTLFKCPTVHVYCFLCKKEIDFNEKIVKFTHCFLLWSYCIFQYFPNVLNTTATFYWFNNQCVGWCLIFSVPVHRSKSNKEKLSLLFLVIWTFQFHFPQEQNCSCFLPKEILWIVSS